MKAKALLLSLWIVIALATTQCRQLSKVKPLPVARLADSPEQKEIARTTRHLAADPEAQLGRYLDAASKAVAAFPDPEALETYHFAVARAIDLIETKDLAPWNTPVTSPSGHPSFTWTLTSDLKANPYGIDPETVKIYPVDRFRIKGSLGSDRERKAGLGVPVIVTIRDPDADGVTELSALEDRILYSMTALIGFDGKEAKLMLVDPFQFETVEFGNQTYDLSADYLAALALMLDMLNPKQAGLDRMIHASRFTGSSRLARLQPYDPDKIPVLFVHGLGDTPATWAEMVARLWKDKTIRDRYQLWVFGYASGQPYPIPTALLRRQLDNFEARYPDKKDLVLVGHSMGGMISRLLATDSTDLTIWNEVFEQPPGENGFSKETQEFLEELIIFEPRDDVARIIYASASHRGSEDAVNKLGRLGAKMVGNPINDSQITTEAIAAARPGTQSRMRNRLPNSIDVLDPDSRWLQTIDTIPVTDRIPFHSIIGDRGRGGNLDKTRPVSSDGIVPYWSSHMEGAVSELIIPTNHWTIHDERAAEEVRRILYLHLQRD